MNVYTIIKEGVYGHHVDGVWSTREGAVIAAMELASQDGADKNRPLGDGYHHWSILENVLDTGESKRVGYVLWEMRGHWERIAPEGVWHDPVNLHFEEVD